MMASRSRFLVCSAHALALFTLSALPAAASSRKAAATPTPTHQVTIISSVTANSMTAETQIVADKGGKVLDKTSRTYRITQFTEISVNGQRAGAADLKPKMKVSVTIGTDPTQAARIVANG